MANIHNNSIPEKREKDRDKRRQRWCWCIKSNILNIHVTVSNIQWNSIFFFYLKTTWIFIFFARCFYTWNTIILNGAFCIYMNRVNIEHPNTDIIPKFHLRRQNKRSKQKKRLILTTLQKFEYIVIGLRIEKLNIIS